MILSIKQEIFETAKYANWNWEKNILNNLFCIKDESLIALHVCLGNKRKEVNQSKGGIL